MRHLALMLSAFVLLTACPSFAQSANTSANPPAYPVGGGSQGLSQTNTGGLRAQPQDGAGHDVSTAFPMPVTGTTAPTAQTSVALDASTVVTLNVAVIALTSAHHAKGGWIGNCNASGTLYVNDNGTATTTEGGSNAALSPGVGGVSQKYYIAPGVQTISVTGSANSMTICGEGYN